MVEHDQLERTVAAVDAHAAVLVDVVDREPRATLDRARDPRFRGDGRADEDGHAVAARGPAAAGGEQQRERRDGGHAESHHVRHHPFIFARLALLTVVAFVVGCGGGAEPRACSPAITGEPERRPPAGMGLPAGAHLYLSEGPFGKTERFYAVVDGQENELVAKRDIAADALVGSGYKLLSKDDEAPIEAEAHVEGERMISVQVTALCDGKLRLRYTVS
jgi:hypothetical protein